MSQMSTLLLQYPSLIIVSGIVLCTTVYYKLYVIRKPLLACSDKKLRRFLTTRCPIVSEQYKPTFWCFESRTQTILRAVLQSKPNYTFTSEPLELPDGGQIVLDWHECEDSEQYRDSDTRPTVLILPGLTGSSQENYILHFVREASLLGYRVVVFNNRGIRIKLRTPRTYCAANTEDLEAVVMQIKRKRPEAPLIGIGLSMGGMILFNYVSRMGKSCGLKAAMVISVPWDVFESTKELERPINKLLFNKILASNLRQNFFENIALFEDHIDADRVLKGETIKDFDEHFTSRMFGYESVEHYYKDASLHEKMHTLDIPVLCLNASDDPFSPYHALPIQDAEEKSNNNVAILVTSHGGHIGFLEGLWPRNSSYMYRLFSQYTDAIFKYGSDLS